MKPRKDSSDKGAGSGCMARLVRFFMLLCIGGRPPVSYPEQLDGISSLPVSCQPNRDLELHRLLRKDLNQLLRRLLEVCECPLCCSNNQKWVCIALENIARQGMSPSEQMDTAKIKTALQMTSLDSQSLATLAKPQRANLVPLAFLGITDGVPFGLEGELQVGPNWRPMPRQQVQRSQSEVVLVWHTFFLPNAES